MPPNAAGGHQAPQPDSRRNVDALAKVPDSRIVATRHDGWAVQRIRAALEDFGSRVQGGTVRFRAVCPSHESHGSLTLAVSQGRSGAAVKCHAGCETSEILAALALCWDDLFDQPREHRDTWRPRRRPADDPMAELKRVLERAVSIINTRSAQDAYRECCPVPVPSAAERVALAIWAEKQDQDRHYWRTLARWAALACDEGYVRDAYAQRAKWLRTRKYEDKPSHEQAMVMLTRAEDLERERGRIRGAA